MRHTIFAAVLAGSAAFFPLAASAQYVGTVGSSSTQVGVIDTDQQPVFRRYVVEERLPSYAVPDRVIVGTTLPEAASVTMMCRSVSVRRPIATRSSMIEPFSSIRVHVG